MHDSNKYVLTMLGGVMAENLPRTLEFAGVVGCHRVVFPLTSATWHWLS